MLADQILTVDEGAEMVKCGKVEMRKSGDNEDEEEDVAVRGASIT